MEEINNNNCKSLHKIFDYLICPLNNEDPKAIIQISIVI